MIDNEHYLFVKPANDYLSTDQPNNLGHQLLISHLKDIGSDDYYQYFKNMYDDVTEQLSKDVKIWCKALSIPQTPTSTKTYQLVLEANIGTLLITGTAIPNDQLDEFLVIAQDVQDYNYETPISSDNEDYVQNTYHPAIILMNQDDQVRPLKKEFEHVEDEDNDEYCDVDDDWNICVNLNSKEQILQILNRLINNFDDLPEYLQFGQKLNGEFQYYQHEENEDEYSQVGLCSELYFFETSAKFSALHKKMIDYINLAIDRNGPWMNEESPKSLYAVYALAMHDQKYIPKYIELLCVLDMDHEVYQYGQIEKLIQKWKKYDNAIRLMVSRCYLVCGQHGFSNLDPDILDSVYRNEIFLKYFLLDLKESHYAYYDDFKKLISYYIEPVLEIVCIGFDEKKIINALKFIHDNASINLSDII